MNLIFFGGVHGVGKTTLIKYLTNTLSDQLYFFDPGIYFRYHLHIKKDKTPAEAERIVVDELIWMKDHANIICHWHYTVWTGVEHVPQLTYPNLNRLIDTLKPAKILSVLVDADANIILERRQKDLVKLRPLDTKALVEEILVTRKAFGEHSNFLRNIATEESVNIRNDKLADTQEKLLAILEDTLGIQSRLS